MGWKWRSNYYNNPTQMKKMNDTILGTTITLEALDMRYKVNADWNHAWGAVPANIILRYMCGIKPKTKGFGLVEIKPQMDNVKNSSILAPSIRGQIKC